MNAPVALVTGASRRIGAGIIKALHKAGYNVVVHYHSSRHEADELTQILNRERATSAVCVQADLNDFTQIKQLAEKALAAWGRMDLLVNNASTFYPTPLATADESHWHDLMNSNLKAPYFLTQALAEALATANGSVINIADIFGQRPMPNHSIYSIAKAGNIMLTKSLALELAPRVRVNGIAPGAMLWPENADGELQVKPEALQLIPLGTLGGVESIANAVLFLATQASYISGHVLPVDGGRSLRQ